MYDYNIQYHCLNFFFSSYSFYFFTLFYRLLDRDQVENEEAAVDDEEDDGFLKAFKVDLFLNCFLILCWMFLKHLEFLIIFLRYTVLSYELVFFVFQPL